MNHPLYKRLRNNSAAWKFEHLENSIIGGIHIFELIIMLMFLAITTMTSAVFVSVVQGTSWEKSNVSVSGEIWGGGTR